MNNDPMVVTTKEQCAAAIRAAAGFDADEVVIVWQRGEGRATTIKLRPNYARSKFGFGTKRHNPQELLEFKYEKMARRVSKLPKSLCQ